MKNYGYIAGAVLTLASLIGVIVSFSSPTQATVNQPVKVLDYQQNGAFDYRVISRPNFFYGGTPPAAPEPSPQIPAKFLESFSLDYTYQPAPGDAGESLEINAILESPGSWKKKVNLIPVSNISLNPSFPLDINHFQDLADTIEKEIGAGGSTHNLTIEAVVSGANGQEFVQVLPIKMTKTYIKIGDNLVSSNAGRTGKFDYRVKLGENTLFGPVTLSPPAAVAAPQNLILGQGDTIFAKFIDNVEVNFAYKLTSSRPLRQVQKEVTIDAVLENPEKWTKTYNLVPPTRQDGDINLAFPLDVNRFGDIFDSIQQDTGVQASKQSLTLKATVHLVAQTEAEAIDQTFTQNIMTDLRNSLLTWSGDMKKSAPGSVTALRPVIIQPKMFGVPVLWVRIASIALFTILLIIVGYSFFRPRARALSRAEIEARSISRKYKEIIVEVNERPEFKPEQTVLPTDSLQDLIKVAQGLLKPIHHVGENGSHIYWVYDDSTRYEFLLVDGKTEKDIKVAVGERTAESPPEGQ